MVDDRIRNLHREHEAFVLRFLSWCCGVRGGDVDDVAQLVWLQMYRLGPAPANARPWLTTIARNVVANERRKASRRRDPPSDGVPDELVAPGLTAEELLALRAYLTELLEAVPSAEHREALFLAAEGLSAEEIAQAQGITPDNARQRVHEARKRIRRTDRACLLPLVAVGFEDFLRPLPPEEIERRWKEIESLIQQHDAPAPEGQPPSVPPPLVVPMPPVPPGLRSLVSSKVTSALAGAVLGGGVALWFAAPASAPTACGEPPSVARPAGAPLGPVLVAPGAVITTAKAAATAAPSSKALPARPVPIELDDDELDRRAHAVLAARAKACTCAPLQEEDDLDRRAREQRQRWTQPAEDRSQDDDLDRRAREQRQRWSGTVPRR